MTSKLKIIAMKAAPDKKQLNGEWIELINDGETVFNGEGCALTVARGGGRQRTVTTLKAGLLVHGGERVRLVSGSSGKKSHGEAPADEGVRNFHLFLKAPFLERPGLVIRLVNAQHTEICRATYGEASASDAG
jgi:hypothetical protein